MFKECTSNYAGSRVFTHSDENMRDSELSDITLSEHWDTSTESSVRCHGASCHLKRVLLDYKQFKAARTIQRHWRGFLTRKQLRIRNEAATTISRWWRGFWVRKFQFTYIQQLLQLRIMRYYHEAATQIQALFRGWRTRQFFQDFQGMNTLRLQYVEDILSTLYRKLFEMKKAKLLPGVYTLRESELLTKIEDLSTTFEYRFHNGSVRAALAMRRSVMDDRRKEFKAAYAFSNTPYPGPFTEDPQACEISMIKRMDTRLQRILVMYERSKKDKHVEKVYTNYSARRRMTMNVQRENKRIRFCTDFARRITKNMATKHTHRDSQAIDAFLDDLLTSADTHNCFCQPMHTMDDSLCQ
ncbi:uncharacterized protein LOC108101363 [Drosophila ficusphila]|uniref:uncharacterized protein LOC108101363 n=1 Tax=Drosophila ficusphila TaxID=30025 RepID=UPI0007E610BC|nr:uncharacterized protein LOC108101363 [Drosophila ficusphila]